ncbi:hypothetical protein NDU88_001119 [Pleurodeles waltl]|uniref:Uncharacterized protein n=1 Tax=Pleurodeles waltl TaxID=8319 RepID=A0AAV7KNM4_PLEWA|nr:hypothetical protein NDU88_001119 [Pleurodeles waltl]
MFEVYARVGLVNVLIFNLVDGVVGGNVDGSAFDNRVVDGGVVVDEVLGTDMMFTIVVWETVVTGSEAPLVSVVIIDDMGTYPTGNLK